MSRVYGMARMAYQAVKPFREWSDAKSVYILG